MSAAVEILICPCCSAEPEQNRGFFLRATCFCWDHPICRRCGKCFKHCNEVECGSRLRDWRELEREKQCGQV